MQDSPQSAFIDINSEVFKSEGRDTPALYPQAPKESNRPPEEIQYLHDVHYGRFNLQDEFDTAKLEKIVSKCMNKRSSHFLTREELITTKTGDAYVILTWVIRTPLKKPPSGEPDSRNNPESPDFGKVEEDEIPEAPGDAGANADSGN